MLHAVRFCAAALRSAPDRVQLTIGPILAGSGQSSMICAAALARNQTISSWYRPNGSLTRPCAITSSRNDGLMGLPKLRLMPLDHLHERHELLAAAAVRRRALHVADLGVPQDPTFEWHPDPPPEIEIGGRPSLARRALPHALARRRPRQQSHPHRPLHGMRSGAVCPGSELDRPELGSARRPSCAQREAARQSRRRRPTHPRSPTTSIPNDEDALDCLLPTVTTRSCYLANMIPVFHTRPLTAPFPRYLLSLLLDSACLPPPRLRPLRQSPESPGVTRESCRRRGGGLFVSSGEHQRANTQRRTATARQQSPVNPITHSPVRACSGAAAEAVSSGPACAENAVARRGSAGPDGACREWTRRRR